MVTELQGKRYSVKTVPTPIFSILINRLQSVEIYAVGALELGTRNVSVGTGIPMAAGESRSITHLDFRKDDRDIQSSLFEIWAVAAVATTAHVAIIAGGA